MASVGTHIAVHFRGDRQVIDRCTLNDLIIRGQRHVEDQRYKTAQAEILNVLISNK